MRRLLPVYLLLLGAISCALNANSHKPQEFLTRIQGTKNEGAEIYQHFCANCHAVKPLISIGAPRYREALDWANRLDNLAQLLKHTEEGINAMPARGGCFECTDEQLLLAIAEMVPTSAKKSILNLKLAHKKDTK